MINRNNYEEYLLLYIDGELSSDERQGVETFLQVNPDLKEELKLLQQTILQPERFRFSEKDMLYRKAEGINLSNYQEYFLLYVDRELHPAEQETVETFVLKNPELQDEFTLLKQTVLPNEWVIFTNKESLYRKEEKKRPVIISLRWASLAAAVMIGIIALVWVLNSGNKPSVTDGATAQKVQPKQNQNTVTGDKPEQTQVVQPDDETTLAIDQKNKSTQTVIQAKQVQQKQDVGPQQIAVVPQQRSTQSIIEPQEITSNPNTGNSNTIGSVASTGLPENNNKMTGISTPDITRNNVQPAVYTEELNTEEEKNKNLYVGALEINTDKVRGFFRKAGRFLSNKVKNKDEDGDKIQVANLEVNKLK